MTDLLTADTENMWLSCWECRATFQTVRLSDWLLASNWRPTAGNSGYILKIFWAGHKSGLMWTLSTQRQSVTKQIQMLHSVTQHTHTHTHTWSLQLFLQDASRSVSSLSSAASLENYAKHKRTLFIWRWFEQKFINLHVTEPQTDTLFVCVCVCVCVCV